MLVLVGHDKWSFSLQINITMDITSIVHWVKDFSMISFLYILLLLLAFSQLFNISFNCKQPASNYMFGVGDGGTGAVCGVCFRLMITYVCMCLCACVFVCVCIYMCTCMCVCIYIYVYVYMYVCMYMYVYMCVCVRICVYACMHIHIYMQNMYMYEYVYVCVCMYIHVYVYMFLLYI